MAGLTPRARRTLLLVGVLYAAVVIPIGIRKGDDLESHLQLADGLLRGLPLYQSTPALGVWWPPFAILAVTPFSLLARLSLPVAKGAYALLSVACLGWSIARIPSARWGPVILALAAVAVPLQTNFEYLNMNAVLLAVVVAAELDLAVGHEGRAGVWLGIATALKLFPGLLLAYCAYRGRWRAVAVGAAVALGASLAALLPYGLDGALAVARRWTASTLEGSWLLHGGNQSLTALVGRAGGSHALAVAVQLGVLGLAAVALGRRATDDELPAEVGAVTLLAILLSPIAWSHYYLLAFPAWVAVLERPPLNLPGIRAATVVAGVLTSGFLTVWSRGFKLVLLAHSAFAWGGLLLCAVLLMARVFRPPPLKLAQERPAGPAAPAV